jgi:predicted PurR-regulated permease PerM
MDKMLLGTLNRDILFIIIVAVMLIILTYVIAQNMSALDMKVPNMLNSTSGASGSAINSIGQNIESSSASESENIGRIASVPNKCLGSALCPD